MAIVEFIMINYMCNYSTRIGFMTVIAHNDISVAMQEVLGTILCLAMGTKNEGPIPITG